MKTTGIILAGGKSSRMGKNKALLPFGDKKVIERIVEKMQMITDHVILVTNTFEEYKFLNLPMVADQYKGLGPLAGIHAGLEASRTDHNLVVACDMPFVSVEIGAYLLRELNGFHACVPEIYGQLHPLFAAYHRDTKDILDKKLAKGELKVRNVFQELNVKIITEKDFAAVGLPLKDSDFFNMNYPQEYEMAQKLATKAE